MNINWEQLPYDHAGRWEKKVDSIMNPGSRITWPQFIAEMVIYWRTRFFKEYKDVPKGPNWHQGITKPVRDLNQQAATICNYFPHPDDEPLVIVAFKNHFRNQKPVTIGQFRKIRVTKKGSQNITQAEKDIVLGVTAELTRLIKQRDSFLATAPIKTEIVEPEKVTFKTDSKPVSSKKGSLGSLLALEKKIKSSGQ